LPRSKKKAHVPRQKKELTCASCGKLKKESEFYASYHAIHSATGRLPYCKECIQQMCLDINGNISIEKLQQTLKLLDRPYIRDLWDISVAENPASPIGIYFKNLGLAQNRQLTWKDSCFDTLENSRRTGQKILLTQNNNDFVLTDDIIEFFGEGYSDEEYCAMYRKYNFLKNNYPEKTNMHIEALKTYVRFKVKEEFAVANGDVGEAARWADLANKAATNAKINPSQLSAADLQNGLSTFGQLVRAVEQAVDIIPILPRFKKKPKDSVDFNLWCYINYIRDLKGLPLVSYEEIYAFYEKRKREYIEQESADIFEKEEEDENGEL